MSLKSLSEQKIKMADLLLPGHCTTSSLAILFQSENVMFFRDYDVIWQEYPPKLRIPRDFGWFHLVKCITITKLNVTIPVLFKTSIKASPHPPSPPPFPPQSLPHPYSPTSLPTAICVLQSVVKSFRYPPLPPTLPPTPWFCPTYWHTHNFCID